MTVTIKKPDGTEIVLVGPGAEVCLCLEALMEQEGSDSEDNSDVGLTEVEKDFLTKMYADGYRWIARDKDGDLYVFEEKPKWDGRMWGPLHCECDSAPSELFAFVRAEAREPTEIEPIIRAFIEEVDQ